MARGRTQQALEGQASLERVEARQASDRRRAHVVARIRARALLECRDALVRAQLALLGSGDELHQTAAHEIVGIVEPLQRQGEGPLAPRLASELDARATSRQRQARELTPVAGQGGPHHSSPSASNRPSNSRALGIGPIELGQALGDRNLAALTLLRGSGNARSPAAIDSAKNFTPCAPGSRWRGTLARRYSNARRVKPMCRAAALTLPPWRLSARSSSAVRGLRAAGRRPARDPRGPPRRRSSARRGKAKFFGLDRRRRGRARRREHEHALERVLQLAHVSRPGVRAQRNQRRFAEGRAATLCDALRRSIRRAAIAGRSSRRARKSDVERHDGDAPVQVGAKLAGLDRFAWVAHRRAHHAHVDRQRAARPSGSTSRSCNTRQELAYKRQRQRRCHRAPASAVGLPEAARSRVGARERADLVSNNSASTSVGPEPPG